MAKQLAHQQLRVMGIISAIELDEWRGLRQFSGLDAVFVQQIGKQRFPYASLAQQQHMHAVSRIKDGSLPLFDLMEQARITLQELVHVHHILGVSFGTPVFGTLLWVHGKKRTGLVFSL